MNRYHLAHVGILCTAAAGVFAWVQAVPAQAPPAKQASPTKQAQSARPALKSSRDLATLVQAGDSKAALQQIQSGADVNRAQPDGTTALIWAVYRKDYDVAEALIAKKANPNAGNQFGANPLSEAARQDDTRLVKLLLDAGARADSANPDGETALMTAISDGNLPMVQMLVNAGANVNTIEKFHNQTPLMYAVNANRDGAAMVKLLLSKGADPKPRSLYSDWPSQLTSEPRAQYRSVGGLTALLYATRSGCYDCVEALLASGADINDPTPEGITPLMNALDNEHNGVAKLLIDKGANLDVWDWWGRTALWVAVDRKAPIGGRARGGFGGGGGARGGRGGARGGRGGGGGARGGFGPGPQPEINSGPTVSSMEIIETLLNKGVDPNPIMNFHRPNAPGRGRFADNEISTGSTPLFRAVQNDDVEVVKALLAKGADPNVNTMGYSPLLLAAGAGPGGRGGATAPNTEILDALLASSANVNAKVSGTTLYSFDVSRENMGNKEALTKEGTSALHEAARSVRPDLVKLLLEHGANPDLLDASGKKPIDVVGVPRVATGGNAINIAGRGPAGQTPAAGRGGASGIGDVAAPGAAPARGGAGGRGQARGGAPRGGGGARGGNARGGTRGGPDPAAEAEVRAMLEAASAKK